MQHRDSSTENDSTIQPAEFSFGAGSDKAGGGAGTEKGAAAPTGKRKKSQIPAIATGTLLLLGAVGVFWVLPQVVEKPKPRPPAAADAKPAETQQEKIQASPYTDAEIAQQRRDVQKILQDILMLQEDLEDRQIEVWAGEEYSAARELAEAADGIYRQRKFKQALDKYRESLTALQALRDGIPERIEKHLAEGDEALDRGDAEAAHKAFDLVLIISDEHPRGKKGKVRAKKLPEAWQHFTAGKEAFTDRELDTARDALQQSLEVDPETKAAKELLPQVLAAINERDYSEAMSAGYAAIAEEDFTAARAAFKRAQKLKPEAGEPAIGLQQAQNGAQRSHIEQLVGKASQQEASEDWHGAVKSYTELLEKDPSLVSAITGKARAQARAKLDDQLRGLLEDPLTLGDSKRNQYARGVLTDARQLEGDDSPKLQQQIDELENALTRALIPVPVRLQSDRTTNVAIYRVGRLGSFDEREITLKPGRYTAVGTREGYRDVRREFTVSPGEEPPTVVIQCAEKIISANNS